MKRDVPAATVRVLELAVVELLCQAACGAAEAELTMGSEEASGSNVALLCALLGAICALHRSDAAAALGDGVRFAYGHVARGQRGGVEDRKAEEEGSHDWPVQLFPTPRKTRNLVVEDLCPTP